MTPSAPTKRGLKTKLPAAVAVGSFSFKGEIPVGELEAILAYYLRRLGLPKAGVTLLLCGDKESRDLNRAFRGIDKATDILSFPELAKAPPKGYAGLLGDLALSIPYAWRKRGRYSDAFERELAFLILHGLLHLTGVHHDTPGQERRMQALMRRHFPPPADLLEALSTKLKTKQSWSH